MVGTFSNPRGVVSALALHPGMTVADLGAGSGAYTFAAAEFLGASGLIHAIEVQKQLVEKLASEARSRRIGIVKPRWGNIEVLGGSGLKDGTVDAAILANTLFQADDHRGMLNEALRVLKPGGKLLVVDWNESHGGLGPQSGQVLPAKKLKELADDLGFLLEKEVNAGAHHYGYVFRKRGGMGKVFD